MKGTYVSVVRHDSNDGPGRAGRVLQKYQMPYVVSDFRAGSSRAPNLDQSSGLIVLGGDASVNRPSPFLQAEFGLVEQALGRGLPVLGICLGAQILATVLGARVSRMKQPEIGWHKVREIAGAAGDLLFDGWGEQTVFHWHNEAFPLPSGAVALACSDVCPVQAFRYGDRAWGVQFHPEAEPRDIERWVTEDAASGPARELWAPIDPYQEEAALEELAERFFGPWVELCEQS